MTEIISQISQTEAAYELIDFTDRRSRRTKKTRISARITDAEMVYLGYEVAKFSDGTEAVERYRKARRKEERKNIKQWLASDEAKALGLSENERLRYSRRAGCSCGCSPAFILDRLVCQNGSPLESIFLR